MIKWQKEKQVKIYIFFNGYMFMQVPIHNKIFYNTMEFKRDLWCFKNKENP